MAKALCSSISNICFPFSASFEDVLFFTGFGHWIIMCLGVVVFMFLTLRVYFSFLDLWVYYFYQIRKKWLLYFQIFSLPSSLRQGSNSIYIRPLETVHSSLMICSCICCGGTFISSVCSFVHHLYLPLTVSSLIFSSSMSNQLLIPFSVCPILYIVFSISRCLI